MNQSLSRIYIHLILQVNQNSPKLLSHDIPRISNYISSIINESDCVAINTNGVIDHIHTLYVLPNKYTISEIIQLVKRKSTQFLST